MTPPRYLVRVNDRTLGPHSLETLQQMASVHAFDESALISEVGTEQWAVLRDLPELRASLFPGARKFQLKEKPFVTVNQPNNEPLSVEQMLRSNITHAQPSEPPVVSKTPRSNRRRQDFLFAMFCGFAVLGLAVAIIPHLPFTNVLVVSFAVLYTVGLYWVFYHVMDRY